MPKIKNNIPMLSKKVIDNDINLKQYLKAHNTNIIKLDNKYIKGNIIFEKGSVDQIIIHDTTIIGDIDLEEASIKKLKISDSTLVGDLLLKKSEIEEEIILKNINITRDFVMEEAKTDKAILKLEDATINGDVILEKSLIKEIDYEQVTIKGDNLLNNLNNIKNIKNVDQTKSIINLKDTLINGNLEIQSASSIGKLVLENTTIISDLLLGKSKISELTFKNSVIRGECTLESIDAKFLKKITYHNTFASIVKLGKFNDKKNNSIIRKILEKSDDLLTKENLYRNAKMTYEKLGDRETADHYFYNEMRARRQRKNRAVRFAEWLIVDFTSKYGTNYLRPILIWLIVVLFLSPLVYYFGKGIDGANTFFDCLYFSIVTATTLGYGDLKPSIKAISIPYTKNYITFFFRLYASIEAIFGTFMWAIFLLVFARKYMK